MANQFPKGESGNANGRPKGARNQASREIKEVSRKLLESRAYRKSLRERLIAGTCPQMEVLLHYYAFGRPVHFVAPINPDGSVYEAGRDTEEIVALIADIRILLGRTEEVAPEPTKKLQ